MKRLYTVPHLFCTPCPRGGRDAQLHSRNTITKGHTRTHAPAPPEPTTTCEFTPPARLSNPQPLEPRYRVPYTAPLARPWPTRLPIGLGVYHGPPHLTHSVPNPRLTASDRHRNSEPASRICPTGFAPSRVSHPVYAYAHSALLCAWCRPPPAPCPAALRWTPPLRSPRRQVLAWSHLTRMRHRCCSRNRDAGTCRSASSRGGA